MTLKKFLEKYIDAFADVYNNGEYLGCSDILDIKYKEWRVDKVFPAYSKSDLRCGIMAINIEPPKKKKKKSYKIYKNKESGHIFVEDKHDKAKQLESILDTDAMESGFKKEYRELMKKYVKEHLDEIGLKDGGYAGDSADDDGCWNCKYVEKHGYEEPCVKCSHSYFDRWESKE